MKTENSGKSRMWKDAPAALCEFVGVDPARKWAQCEKERDEWAALAGQYKRERDEAREKYFALRDLSNNATELAEKYKQERDEAREALENHMAATIHTCHDECKRPMCVLRRERDEAREQLKILQERYSELLGTEVTK